MRLYLHTTAYAHSHSYVSTLQLSHLHHLQGTLVNARKANNRFCLIPGDNSEDTLRREREIVIMAISHNQTCYVARILECYS